MTEMNRAQGANPAGADLTQANPAPKAPSRPASKRRPGKVALRRAKLAAIAISVVAFVGTLAGISRTGAPTSEAALAAAPIASAPVAPAQSRQRQSLGTGLQAPVKPAPFVMPAMPQSPNVSLRPFGRTRGS